MVALTIALFGEAEKGAYRTAYYCHDLPELVDYFGNPPPESLGLYYAIQALLHHRKIIFFRVQEEGFSLSDYEEGLEILKTRPEIPQFSAICAPGLGNSAIIEEIVQLCSAKHSIMITSQADLYDYLTG